MHWITLCANGTIHQQLTTLGPPATLMTLKGLNVEEKIPNDNKYLIEMDNQSIVVGILSLNIIQVFKRMNFSHVKVLY